MQPSSPHDMLITFLREGGVDFRILDHPACRTSVESAAARAAAGAPGSVGAKALLLMAGSPTDFVMAVLPGNARIANNIMRELIGKFRFANVEEIAKITLGLQPGMIPPFGTPVFPLVRCLIVDKQIGCESLIGFNAATFEKSIVMNGAAYLSLVPSAILSRLSEERPTI